MTATPTAEYPPEDHAPLWGGGPVGGWGVPPRPAAIPPRAPGPGRAARPVVAVRPAPGAPWVTPGTPCPPARPGPAPGTSATRTADRPARRGGPILAVLAVAVAAAAVLGFVAPGFLVTRVLDDAAFVQGVAQVLDGDYGLRVDAVRCPSGVRAAADVRLTCTATLDGREVGVPVRFTDRYGGYEVGRPLPSLR